MFGLRPYNYESFTYDVVAKDLARHSFGSGPEPGERAPDFELRSLEGDRVRLSDFQGSKNVVLTFGSATCPFTASSIRGLNELYSDFKDDEDVQFLFVFIREAHPGERLGPHRSLADKIRAAEEFRDAEDVEFPILIDELDGKVHKKYSKMANPSFLIDKSGRVAFRQLWTRPRVLGEALEELLDVQEHRSSEHAIVRDGEDTAMPITYAMLHSHRALERGGQRAIREFRREMGSLGRIGHTASRVVGPVALHPGRAMTGVALTAGVIAGSLYLGMKLREKRLARRRDVYHYGYKQPRAGAETDYAVGI